MLFTYMYSFPVLQLVTLDLYRNKIRLRYKSNIYAYPKMLNFAALSYICSSTGFFSSASKSKNRLVVESFSSWCYKTIHLKLSCSYPVKMRPYFLPNKLRNELSDFFRTLNCWDKNLTFEVTTISRFTCVFINFAKILPKMKLVISFLQAD